MKIHIYNANINQNKIRMEKLVSENVDSEQRIVP